MRDVPGRSASGVRLAGDDYQHLITWNEVLISLLPGSDVESVAVEDSRAASVDDIVVMYHSGRVRYLQVKHAVGATTPVGSDWLMAARDNSKSVLQKFFDSWESLGGNGSLIEMELVSDRQIDPSDPVMACYDTASERLTPLIASRALSKVAKKGRSDWVEHIGCSEARLVEMLESLRIRTGRPPAAELERAQLLMRLHGLSADQAAIDSAMAFVREWVQERWRELPLEELRIRVTQRIPGESDPWSLVVIEGIDNLRVEVEPVESLRFVERYESGDPFERRQLRDPAEWPAVYDEIVAAANRMRDAGRHRVLLRGAMRLPMWFAAGAAFRHVRGFTVATQQGPQLWASEQAATTQPLDPGVHPVGAGPDLAVVVGVAADAAPAVLKYIETATLPVAELLSFVPPGGAGNESIATGQDAATFAASIKESVRAALISTGATRIHLFLAAPAGLALLLGHRWNALASTTVYEHLGGASYAPTMRIPA